MAGTMIDYTKVTEQADRIDALTNTFTGQIQTLESLLQNVKSGWCGPASDMYQKQLQRLLTDMRDARQQMGDLSQNIRETAQRLQSSDNI